jgi:hypothetical protein
MFFIGPVFEYRAYIDLADLNGVEIITFPETSDLKDNLYYSLLIQTH